MIGNTKGLIERFHPQQVVGDHAATAYIAAFNRQYGSLGTYIRNAEKLGKLGAVTLMNGGLASGQLKLLPEAAPLADEYLHLPWENEKRVTEHPGHENHCSDSGLYAYRAHPVSPFPKALPPPKTPAQLAAEAQAARRTRAKDQQSRSRW